MPRGSPTPQLTDVRRARLSSVDSVVPVTVTVRTARVDEGDALRALYRRSASTNEGGRRAFAARPELAEPADADLAAGRVRVAVDGDRPVGFAVTVPVDDDTAELDAMFVEPDEMRRGIGRLLIDDAVALASEAGVAVLRVVAGTEAVPFYRRCGFVDVGPVATEFGDAVEMRRDLG